MTSRIYILLSRLFLFVFVVYKKRYWWWWQCHDCSFRRPFASEDLVENHSFIAHHHTITPSHQHTSTPAHHHNMSKRMVDTFFPACVDRIDHNRVLSFLYHDIMFPDTVAEKCPEYTYNMQNQWNIRQPCLLLAALWGIWIGVSGFLQLRSTKRIWAVALLTFGIMNASAVFVHCLWPAPRINYPIDYPIFWVIDTYMTGVSGSCLLMASLEELQHRWAHFSSTGTISGEKRQPQSELLLTLLGRVSIYKVTMVIELLGILCIAWFATDPSPRLATASHPLELWYLVPPVAAGGPVLMVLYENVWTCATGRYYPKSSCSKRDDDSLPSKSLLPLSVGQLVFGLSVIVAGIMGLVMDRFWCTLVGCSLARDFLSANTLVFLSCDMAFWGIASFLSETSNSQGQKKDAWSIGSADTALSW